jgi:hypothetical protein
MSNFEGFSGERETKDGKLITKETAQTTDQRYLGHLLVVRPD